MPASEIRLLQMQEFGYSFQSLLQSNRTPVGTVGSVGSVASMATTARKEFPKTIALELSGKNLPAFDLEQLQSE